MSDPLKEWQQISKDELFVALPDAEKARAREVFIKNTAGEDGKIAKFLDFATKDLEKDVFNDPAFAEMDEQARKDVVKANFLASGKIDDAAFEPRLKGLRKSYADELAEGALKKYKAQAVMAGFRSPVLGAAQLAGTVGEALGTDGELLQQANADIRQDSALKKRAPVAAGLAEVGSQGLVGLLTPVTKGSGFLGNLIANAGKQAGAAFVTTPIEVDKGTPAQESQDVLSGKGSTAALAGGLSAGADVVTSPQVVNMAGNAGRWVKGAFNADGMVGDVADDIVQETVKQNKDIVRNLRAEGKLAAKATPEEILSSIQAEKARLEEATEVGGKKTLFTGQEAGDTSALKEVQRKAGKVSPDEVLARYEAAVNPAAKTVAESVDELPPGEAAEYVRLKYIPEANRQASLNIQQQVAKQQQTAKDAANKIWSEARSTGVLATPAGVTAKQYGARIDDVLKDMTVKDKKSIKTLMTRPKRLGKDLSFDDIVLDKMALLDAKTPQNAAFIDRMVAVQDELLGDAGLPAVRELFERTKAEEMASKAIIKQLQSETGIEKAISTQFTKEPIKKALASNSGAATLADAVISPNTPIEQLQEVLADPTMRKHVKAAVASDITDNINYALQKTQGLTPQKVAERYAGSEAKLQELFKDSPEILDALKSINETGTATGQIKRALGASADEGSPLSTYPLEAAAGQLGGVRTGALGPLSLLAEKANRATRRLVRESFSNKELALKLLTRAEKIQKGRVDYKALWDASQGVRGTGARLPAGQIYNESTDTRPLNEEETSPETIETPTPDLTEQQESGIIPNVDEDMAKAGLPPELRDIVIDMAGVESGFGENTVNPLSSAAGAFQVVDETWDAITKPEYTDSRGRLKKGKNLEGRLGRTLDKNAASDGFLVAMELAKEHYGMLEKQRIPTKASNLYILHALGAKDGLALLKMEKAAPYAPVSAVDLKPDVLAGHPNFFTDGASVGQALNNARRYYTSRAKNKKARDKFVQANALGTNV